MPVTEVVALDISGRALETARKNAFKNKLNVNFVQVDFLNPKSWTKFGQYDIIVSNPPYVRESEKTAIKKNVLDYEPELALFVPDQDPMVFYKHIADFGKTHLKNNGMVYCEINQYLANETQQVFEKAGFKMIEIRNDLSGNKRFLSCFILLP
jgi:release factor glutamine methyltransferase